MIRFKNVGMLGLNTFVKMFVEDNKTTLESINKELGSEFVDVVLTKNTKPLTMCVVLITNKAIIARTLLETNKETFSSVKNADDTWSTTIEFKLDSENIGTYSRFLIGTKDSNKRFNSVNLIGDISVRLLHGLTIIIDNTSSVKEKEFDLNYIGDGFMRRPIDSEIFNNRVKSNKNLINMLDKTLKKRQESKKVKYIRNFIKENSTCFDLSVDDKPVELEKLTTRGTMIIKIISHFNAKAEILLPSYDVGDSDIIYDNSLGVRDSYSFNDRHEIVFSLSEEVLDNFKTIQLLHDEISPKYTHECVLKIKTIKNRKLIIDLRK